MAESRRARSMLATVVGYVLAAVVIYLLFQLFIGTIFWLIRAVVVIVIIGGLLTLYLKLKSPD